MYPYFFVNLITALLITNARETTTKKIRTDWAPRRQIREEKCDLIKTTCLSYRVTVRESVWNVLEYIIMWARSIDKVNKNHFNAKSLINLNKSYEHHATCMHTRTHARTHSSNDIMILCRHAKCILQMKSHFRVSHCLSKYRCEFI